VEGGTGQWLFPPPTHQDLRLPLFTLYVFFLSINHNALRAHALYTTTTANGL
jgi:hypothetical protein